MDVDMIFKIAAIGIIVAVLNQVLIRSGREEQAMMTTLAGLIVVLMMLISEISNLFDTVKIRFRTMNEIVTVAGIAVASAGAAVLLKQYKPEYAFGISVAAGAIFLLFIAVRAGEIIDEINAFASASGINSENYGIVLRCLGVCLVTNAAAETCKDCGQSSIASKLVIAGKALVLIIALPLFSELMNVIKAILEIR